MKIITYSLILTSFIILSCEFSTFYRKPHTNRLKINDDYMITPNSLRLNLLTKYTKDHYGEPYIYLDNPEIIVIHSTETKTLNVAVNVFQREILIGRKDIHYGGEVNVGTHFLVDTNGEIYKSTPTDYIVRHTIGFNHKSISIENIGYAGQLTKEQLKANIELIKYLKQKYSSIKYVIGHYEYMDNTRPHFRLYKELNSKYIPTIKSDPGSNFIYNIRKNLN